MLQIDVLQSDTDEQLSVRDRNKATRRAHILATAAGLLADEGPEGLSMRRLADAAELSVNTIYNLIGPRDLVMSSLVEQVLEAIEPAVEAEAPADPIDRCVAVIEQSTAHVIDNRALTRPLALEIFASDSPASNTAHQRGTAMMRSAIEDAQAAGSLEPAFGSSTFAETVYAMWSNAALRWAHGAISDEGFLACGVHGLHLALFAAGADTTRDRLRRDLAEADQHLAQVLAGSPDNSTRRTA